MYDKVGTSGQYQSSSNIVTVSLYQPVQVQIINPSSTKVDVGQQMQLSASASGGTNAYTYQWFSNGNPIAGANSASYTYYPTDTGTVSIYVTAKDTQDSTLATATSNTVTLTTPLTANLQSTIPTSPTATPIVPELTSFVVLLTLAIATCSFMLVKVVKQKASKRP